MQALQPRLGPLLASAVVAAVLVVGASWRPAAPKPVIHVAITLAEDTDLHPAPAPPPAKPKPCTCIAPKPPPPPPPPCKCRKPKPAGPPVVTRRG